MPRELTEGQVPSSAPSGRCVTAAVLLREWSLPKAQEVTIFAREQLPYSTQIFSSFLRLALIDSSTELLPLIHNPPSRRSSSGIGP